MLNNKKQIISLSILNVLSSISLVLIAYLSKLVIDSAINKDIEYLKYILLFIGITIFLDIIFKVGYKYLYYYFYVKDIKILKEKVYLSSLLDVDNKNITDYIQNFNEDINNILNYKLITIPNLIYNIGLLLTSSILLLLFNYKIFIILLLIMLIIVTVGFFYLKTVKSKVKERQSEQALLTAYYKDSIQNKELCKLYTRYDNFKLFFNKHNNKYINKLKSEGILYTTSSSLIYIFSNLLLLTLLIISSYLILKDLITVGSIALLIQLFSYIINPLFSIPSIFSSIGQAKASIDRLRFNTINIDVEQIDDFDAIIFKDLTFTYDNTKNIIENLNYTIYKNDIIKISGMSGKGKSTLLRLIFKEIKPTSGEIIVKYKDCNYQIESIYHLIGYLPQENILFNEDIRTNFNIYQNISDDEIYNLLTIVGLDKRINSLDISINDKNSNLSTGEKQRLLLAITLSLHKEILILDEYNSALDSENNMIIDNILNSLNKTIIYINHKDELLNNSKILEIK